VIHEDDAPRDPELVPALPEFAESVAGEQLRARIRPRRDVCVTPTAARRRAPRAPFGRCFPIG